MSNIQPSPHLYFIFVAMYINCEDITITPLDFKLRKKQTFPQLINRRSETKRVRGQYPQQENKS